jgi:short subunit dehydrogenase-like uncharacterized protein
VVGGRVFRAGFPSIFPSFPLALLREISVRPPAASCLAGRIAMQRRFDVVVFGATGFTGALICEYLGHKLASGREDFSFAIAGRNREALSAVAARCSGGGPPPALIVADASEPASLRRMAAQARTVVSSVGPFTVYGEPLVEACIATGTHYCDTTGEVNFVLG